MNILIFILIIGIISYSNINTIYYNKTSLNNLEEAFSTNSIHNYDNEFIKSDSFYMVIDPQGNIVDSFNLPVSLNHHYNISEIASFVRWYLEDYPVDTRITNDGFLIVEGFPKNTVVKYSLTIPTQVVVQDILLFPALLFINLLIFIYILYKKERKTEKDIKPILASISLLSGGSPVSLKEEGPLYKIKASLNSLSQLLEKKETERREWISSISHDIKTPLSVITTSTELIQTKNIILKERVLNNVIRIKQLIDNLNLLNKLEYGFIPNKLIKEDFAKVLRESIINVLNENDLSDYELQVNISEDTNNILLSMNKDLVSRLISNLIQNAYKHNPVGTEIIVSTKKEYSNLYLTIENNKNTQNEFKIGQGLRIVNRVCQIHNWDLKIENRSNFKVSITIPIKI